MSTFPQNLREITRIGHYEILDSIGRGGMGLVYLARDTRLDRQVAIKCLRTELFEPHYRERFKREALLLAKLNHPNIVQIYDFIETADQLALVMEYVDGQNLQIRLREQLASMPQRMAWLIQIAQGLAVAHDSGIIHRDLKAENILINKRNDAKISDLGIAKSQDFNATITDHVAGSYASMSPEQAMGDTLDFKSDLFSFGILAYQLLCGAHPFGETTNKLQLMQRIISHPPIPPKQYNPNLPAEISDLLLQLLSKNQDNRPANTHWVANQLDKLSPLILHTPTESNDTEVVPQSLSAAATATHDYTASARTEHLTFDTRYHNATPPIQKIKLREFIQQQKNTIVFASFAILAMISISVWLLQPKPPRYVAVIPPNLNATQMNESQQALVKDAVYTAIQQSVLEFNGFYLIPLSEITDINSDIDTVLHATGADELITSTIQCKIESCAIVLSRISPDPLDKNKLRIQGTRKVDVLTDNYLSVASIVQNNMGNLYSRKSTNLLQMVDEQDYVGFLKASQTLRHQGASSELLDGIESYSEPIKKLTALQTLYKEIALDLYYESKDPIFLEKLEKFLLRNSPGNENVVALYNIHRLQIAKNQYDDALKTADKLKALNTNQTLIYELNAHTMMAKNDYQTAIEYYKNSLKLKRTANNLINISNAYWYSGNTTRAKGYLEEAISLAPNQHKAHSLYGLIALMEGHVESAAESFEKVIEQKPNDITNLSNLGLCYLLMKEYDHAYHLFSRAAELAPQFKTLALNQADAKNLAGKEEDADKIYTAIVRSITSHNISVEDLRSLAQAHAHLDNFSEALTSLKELERKDPQNIETSYTAALVHSLAHNNASAIFNIENTLKNGMNTIWFSFPWFDSLCSHKAFLLLMQEYGEPNRCALHTVH